MPAVKNVGEPCAGEPHARFDGEGLETEPLATAPVPHPTGFDTRLLGPAGAATLASLGEPARCGDPGQSS